MLSRRLAENECFVIGDPSNQDLCVVVATKRKAELVIDADREVPIRSLQAALEYLAETNQEPCLRVQKRMERSGIKENSEC